MRRVGSLSVAVYTASPQSANRGARTARQPQQRSSNAPLLCVRSLVHGQRTAVQNLQHLRARDDEVVGIVTTCRP